ncbi:MAG: thioredoxin [Rhodobacteraceae bacterium]|nr:thioredoxin [Paracoccaceae bacterium]
MRLICPNCGAQYDVEDAVIPDQGRDVQCSNCGHTWFQQPAHLDPELAEELGREPPPPMEDEPVEPQPEAADRARRGLDPDVAGVLREEAERETSARRAEAETGIETQPDLGLDTAAEIAASRSAAARSRMARLRGLDDDAEAETAAAAAGSRRERLPDVEEINSSLRASQDREAVDEESGAAGDSEVARPERRSGRLLSRLIILAAILALLVYMLAPQIGGYLPQSEPHLTSYVDWVNGLRDQLNGLIERLVGQVRGDGPPGSGT